MQKLTTVLFPSALIALVVAPTTCAQMDWTRLVLTTEPPLRKNHALATDPVTGQVVLFGGATGTAQPMADTWSWNGVAWSQASPTTAPSARRAHAMAAERTGVLLFGGRDATGAALGGTWSWQGSNWVRRLPTAAPPARRRHAMAYDSGRQRVVLFGGLDASGAALGDTWEWDGRVWVDRTPVPPAASPSPRGAHGLAYDAARGRVVLFGGQDPTCLGDTWEWDGSTWTRRVPATSPPPRAVMGCAYDAARNRVVVFSGVCDGSGLTDTWEWDGVDWCDRSTPTRPPAANAYGGLAFDPNLSQLLLFGGNGQGRVLFQGTWIYRQTVVDRVVTTGPGCGNPPPTLSTTGRPLVGNRGFGWQIGTTQPGGLAFLALSLAAGPQTVPGCTVHPRMPFDAVIALPLPGTGIAQYPLPIPCSPGLSGATVWSQGFVIVTGGPLFGLAAATQGLAVTVGD